MIRFWLYVFAAIACRGENKPGCGSDTGFFVRDLLCNLAKGRSK